jgi:hypothetical protein
MEDLMPIYKVPEENLPKLTAQIEKLQKRVLKLNVGAITFKDLGFTEHEYMKNGFPRIRRIHDIEISGPAPKINGWTFAATLQPMTDEEGNPLGNILRVVPGMDFTIPEQYRNAGNNCDHCHTERRRNDTFILHGETGWKQVGRNCLRDFLGHQSPEAFTTMAQILIDASELGELAGDDGYDGSGGRRIERFAAEEFLTIAAAMIRTYGFRSNKVTREFGGQSTSGAINEFVNGDADSRKKNFANYSVTDADSQQAADVYAWLQSLGHDERTASNDYLYNLSLLGQGATFTTRNFGLATSAIATWAKEQEREINRRKRFAEDLNSQYVGAIGERIVFTATVVYTNKYESDFGVSHFYKFKTDEGNILGYFASNDMGWEIGAKVTLKGTVKKQEERKGVKTTTVTRCALFVPKDVEKAIKKLQHAASKGVWGAMTDFAVCPDNNYRHSYDERFCTAPHAIEWDNTALYKSGDDFAALQEAEKTIQKLIDELTQSAQPQPEAK